MRPLPNVRNDAGRGRFYIQNMVKVYELTRFDGMQVQLNWCGKIVRAEFKGGDTRHRASLTTANLFVQDALENDVRFGKLFVLKKVYEDTPQAREKVAAEAGKKKRITRVKTTNEALRYLAENGYKPNGEDDLQTLMDKAGVEFPNLPKSAEIK